MHEAVMDKIDHIVEQLGQGGGKMIPFGPFYVGTHFGFCTVTQTPNICPPWVVFTFGAHDLRPRHEHRDHFLRQALYTIWACPEVIQAHMQRRRCTYLLAKCPILNDKRRISP